MTRNACLGLAMILAFTTWETYGVPGNAQDPPSPPASVDPVMAKVNQTEIRASQVEQVLQLSLRRGSRNTDSLSEERMGRLRRQVLDQLVEEELLYQLSQKEKVQVPEKRVDEEVQTLQSRFLSPEEYEASLKEQGLTPALARERVRRNLAVEEIIRQKTTGGAGPSEAEIAEYYKKNRERLRRAESARVQQIFVRLPPRSDPETKGRARQALEALIKEIRAGKDFGAAIREYSQGTDQGPGGDLGWVTRNGPTPILADAALKLKVGEISDVLETPAGFHVLKVLEKKPGGEASLEEARAQVESLLRQQKEREALASLVAKLKTEARIEFVTPVP